MSGQDEVDEELDAPSRNIREVLLNRSYGIRAHQQDLALRKYAEEYPIRRKHEFRISRARLPPRTGSCAITEFSSDGNWIASGHDKDAIHLTNLWSEQVHTHLQCQHPWCIAFHPMDCEVVAAGTLEGKVLVWQTDKFVTVKVRHRVSTRKMKCWIWCYEWEMPVSSLSFHPVEDILMVAVMHNIFLLDWKQEIVVSKIQTNQSFDEARFVRFDCRGDHVMTGVRVSPKSKKEIREHLLKNEKNRETPSAEWASLRGMAVTSTEDHLAQFYDFSGDAPSEAECILSSVRSEICGEHSISAALSRLEKPAEEFPVDWTQKTTEMTFESVAPPKQRPPVQPVSDSRTFTDHLFSESCRKAAEERERTMMPEYLNFKSAIPEDTVYPHVLATPDDPMLKTINTLYTADDYRFRTVLTPSSSASGRMAENCSANQRGVCWDDWKPSDEALMTSKFHPKTPPASPPPPRRPRTNDLYELSSRVPRNGRGTIEEEETLLRAAHFQVQTRVTKARQLQMRLVQQQQARAREEQARENPEGEDSDREESELVRALQRESFRGRELRTQGVNPQETRERRGLWDVEAPGAPAREELWWENRTRGSPGRTVNGAQLTHGRNAPWQMRYPAAQLPIQHHHHHHNRYNHQYHHDHNYHRQHQYYHYYDSHDSDSDGSYFSEMGSDSDDSDFGERIRYSDESDSSQSIPSSDVSDSDESPPDPVVPGPPRAAERRNPNRPSGRYLHNIMEENEGGAEERPPNVPPPQVARPRVIPSASRMVRPIRSVTPWVYANLYDQVNDAERREDNECFDYRLQWWEFSMSKLPQVDKPYLNVVVRDCKIYNSSSVDISKDSSIVACCTSTSFGPQKSHLIVVSLEVKTRGMILYSRELDSLGSSLSISPEAKFIAMSVKHPFDAYLELLGNIYHVDRAHGVIFELGEQKKTEVVAKLKLRGNRSPKGNLKINTIAWIPEPGIGITYGTNHGGLHFVKGYKTHADMEFR